MRRRVLLSLLLLCVAAYDRAWAAEPPPLGCPAELAQLQTYTQVLKAREEWALHMLVLQAQQRQAPAPAATTDAPAATAQPTKAPAPNHEEHAP